MILIKQHESYATQKVAQIKSGPKNKQSFKLWVFGGFFLIAAFAMHNIWLALIAIIILLASNKVQEGIIKTLGHFRRGDFGELAVMNQLRTRLSDEYTYIPNYNNHDFKNGDIDGVLIGPRGLFLIEIKNWRGNFRISGSDFYKHQHEYIYKLFKSPIDQLNSSVREIKDLLKSKSIPVEPVPIIVLVGGKIEEIRGTPGIFVTDLYGLTDKFLVNFPEGKLSSVQIEKLANLLSEKK